ncbi:MAG TPA: serine/threonine-protein kinase [Verrucomicrobiae bacterium]|nr:serine/threonine-protein kinase [Verrucomicrobiae bacterium]
MTEQKQVEKAVFDAALAIEDPAAREAFLDQACSGNALLRARVEKLLRLQSSSEEFFRINASAVVATPADLAACSSTECSELDTAPVVIGRYRLLHRLGEGGCGIVYLAEQQEPVRRRVALKVIRLGMDTERVIARFEAERQALALMDHPNIAHVLDAGSTDSGRPYFVMELVTGTKVTEYCNENRLSLRERLMLFIQICHGIQHAHQKGVIHRDIKPSNVLITLHDGAPVPKVIDFGIAKATQGRLTDNTLYTAADQFIGTPAYMSPEQAERSGLDVDTRSDIYSLGVLLYELVTGRTPFDSSELMKSGVDAMRRTLRDREPRPPSTLLTTLEKTELRTVAAQHLADPPRLISLVAGDLDWIVMKALEKDRRRRYETANGLALDVQRYLNNEPILARPPSRFYRLGKMIRRNKLTFAAISAVTLTLIAGLGTSTWLFLREREARRRAVEAEQQQIQLRKEADYLRQEAERRQKLTEATVLLSREHLVEADRLVAGIPAAEPNLEYAALFRTLGDWHSVHGRWEFAAQRFRVLLQANQPEDWDITTLDYLRCGPVLLEMGDDAGYEEFRKQAINHFAGTTNPLPAERVLKISLLTPTSSNLLHRLEPLAKLSAHTLEGGVTVERSLAAWRSFSLAMYEFRRGELRTALDWCNKSVALQNINPARAVNVQLLMTILRFRQGEVEHARAELSRLRETVETRFNRGLVVGNGSEGFWFDWVFARILLREAVDTIGESHRWKPLETSEL